MLEAFIRHLPKTELHLHLEGSIQPGTLREISSSKGRMEKETEAWIRDQSKRNFRYGSFGAFLQAFKLITLLLETPADYVVATHRMIEALAAQRVRYAEVTLSAGVILWKKQSVPAIFEAICAAAAEAGLKHSVRVQWIFDAIRHFGADHAGEVLRWAKAYRDRGVVAFGIGGDEERGAPELFRDIFAEAKDIGLHRTVHAGETGGPESVARAVELLGAERIGHALSAVRDPEVVALLRDRKITVEACPSSNIATGLVPSIREHPVRQLLYAGVPLTINSDDPAMFGSNLEQELILCADAFGMTADEIAALLKNAVLGSFADEAEKHALLAELEPAADQPPELG